MINRFIFINPSICILFISIICTKQEEHGPSGMDYNDTTTCEEFSKHARFNPYSVLNSEWMVFYYWGPPQSTYVYKFYVPGEKETAYLKKLMEVSVTEPVNWTANYVLMREDSNNTCLLVERSNRGEYDLYPLYAIRKGSVIEPVDVRMKQTGDNRYIGFMSCKAEIVYVMARLRDVPRKTKIQDAAAKVGYRGRGGKSYLYQGHQWMPIPEADERFYWQPARRKQWFLYE